MDPSQPWYTSFNRLSTATFQTTAPNASSNSVTHQLVPVTVDALAVPSTTAPQLLLPATTHTAVTLASQPTSFNSAGFLSTPTVNYEVFTPFFHHANSKQTYVTSQQQQAQPIVRAQVAGASKPASPAEPEISTLTSAYTSPQNETFFEHRATTTSPSAVSWSLSHQTTSQVTSPFGILPHESVTVSSPPDPATIKSTATVTFDNPFVSQYSVNGTTVSGAGTSDFDSDGLTTSYTTDDQSTANSPALHHQSCIVSTPNIANRIRQQSPGPTTIYLNVTVPEKQSVPGEHVVGDDSSQSSPSSFSVMDSRSISYNGGATSKQQSVNGGGVQQQFQLQQSSSCRLYSSGSGTATGTGTECEYHHPARSKSAASTDSAYSSNTSQNGPDCAVGVSRRPSPPQGHSQASPLGHVPSPATYPLYNSPMASVPSPLHADTNSSSTPFKPASGQQQMTPPSSLEVAVSSSPSQQQGHVVYSSVITRANLGGAANDNNKTFATVASNTTDYERSCTWDSDTRTEDASYMSANAAESNVLASQQQQQQQMLMVSNRSSCLESSQMNLHNLKSCQVDGESMSIVKNLQTNGGSNEGKSIELKQLDQQHTCQQIQDKRKSMEKMIDADLTPVTEYLERIPPPAHHNVQQQQHNGFVELDRWNLTLPNAKLVPAAAVPCVYATTQHQAQLHGVNIVGGVNAVQPQQPQLLVTAHHVTSAPSVTYYPTFQITPTQTLTHIQHQSQHNIDSVQLNQINPMVTSNSCQHQQGSNSAAQNLLRDDRPQVIVPNIEEELDFLLQPNLTATNQNNRQNLNTELKRPPTNDPNSGFMTSYLKFLQGEKDSSPPPVTRGGRKASWNNRKPYVPVDYKNGANCNKTDTTATSSDKSKEVPTIDYANDPRYFPLPKERKKHSFDSSDDGFSSDDELAHFGSKKKTSSASSRTSKIHNNSVFVGETLDKPVGKKKGRPIKPGGPTDRKRKAAAAREAALAEAAAKGVTICEPVRRRKQQLIPRRESSRRKAKEKTSEKLHDQRSTDPFDVDEEPGDSDGDPAWTPAAKNAGDEDDKRKKRGRWGRKRLLDDEFTDQQQHSGPKRPGRKKKNFDARSNIFRHGCKIDEKLIATISDEDIDISPFKSGEFVVIKSDLDQEYPPLWRIDGKTLLQKYEPFQFNGKTLYRNISTYSGWAPQNRHIYQQVPIKYWQQDKMETIVEFLREELIIDDSECVSRFMKETEKYQDNFEVYIQTLISQALDSNFLTEISQENDEYFLSNVETVDEITEERKQRLLSTTAWQSNVITALSTWPCVNSLRDNIMDFKGKPCAGCNKLKIYSRVLLYGQPYNSTTLEGSPPDPQVPIEKDFLFCQICQMKVSLFNKVAHQKYLMFLECARRVADKRITDPNKDTTIILNELLADETWLSQIFRDVRRIWAEIDSIQQQAKRKANFSSNAENNDPSLYSEIASASNECLVSGSDVMSVT